MQKKKKKPITQFQQSFPDSCVSFQKRGEFLSGKEETHTHTHSKKICTARFKSTLTHLLGTKSRGGGGRRQKEEKKTARATQIRLFTTWSSDGQRESKTKVLRLHFSPRSAPGVISAIGGFLSHHPDHLRGGEKKIGFRAAFLLSRLWVLSSLVAQLIIQAHFQGATHAT